MTTRELGFLGILGLEDVADAVEKLDVALLRVLLDGRDEGPGHGARGLRRDGGVGAGLVVLAAGPHDDVCGGCLGLNGLLVARVTLKRRLGEAHHGAGYAARVATRVGRDGF